MDLSVQLERELRRKAAKYTLPYFEVLRARMILMAAEGLSDDQIAARLDSRREVCGASGSSKNDWPVS
jgi:hypothetical protein